jgi:SAM-dependent methyltransferase
MTQRPASGLCRGLIAAAALCALAAPGACRREPPPAAATKVFLPFNEAGPILDAFRDSLPPELRGRGAADLKAAWTPWLSAHDAEIRARLARGDEDSIVNLLMYGTSFTGQPRVTQEEIARGGAPRASRILGRRLDDFVVVLGAPGANERLWFARQVIERQGIDLGTEAGQDRARVYLAGLRDRMVRENLAYQAYHRSARSGGGGNRSDALRQQATLYHDRGLSSDTSIPVEFTLDRALDALASQHRLGPGSVRRVAIVGPGLDFTDKQEGFDFYPPQSLQPFALIDSLARLGLSPAGGVALTTFDISPRVNQHLSAARDRAAAGESYVLQLPLTADTPHHQWRPALVQYWRRMGSAVGDDVVAARPPRDAPDVRVRAVRVRPAVVAAVTPRDVNIVVERMEPAPGAGFDLIVATNVLLYYDDFEQALALANIARMLGPGGVFLTNYLVSPRPPLEPRAGLTVSVYWDRQKNGDTMFAYWRR